MFSFYKQHFRDGQWFLIQYFGCSQNKNTFLLPSTGTISIVVLCKVKDMVLVRSVIKFPAGGGGTKIELQDKIEE